MQTELNAIRMSAEIRTDFDCEVAGLPAERWGEAVFKTDGHEIIMEISCEEKTTVAIMIDEDAMWKGTLDGLKELLRSAVKKR
jgi:hypothetical protein